MDLPVPCGPPPGTWHPPLPTSHAATPPIPETRARSVAGEPGEPSARSGRAGCGPWAGSRRAQGPPAGRATEGGQWGGSPRARGCPQGMFTSQAAVWRSQPGGRGRTVVGECVGATSLLSKRCLCSRETEGALHPGQQRPPRPRAAHLGLLLEPGHVQEHLCDLPVEHADAVPVQEEGAVLVDVHLREGAGAEAG